MFNILPITNTSLNTRLDSLNVGQKILIFPMAELTRSVPDSLNEYTIDTIESLQNLDDGSTWKGTMTTVRVSHVFTEKSKALVLSGIICVTEGSPDKDVFWYDLESLNTYEIQCYRLVTTDELALVLLNERAEGLEGMKKLLSDTYTPETP